jgi:hypothetical protein
MWRVTPTLLILASVATVFERHLSCGRDGLLECLRAAAAGKPEQVAEQIFEHGFLIIIPVRKSRKVRCNWRHVVPICNTVRSRQNRVRPNSMPRKESVSNEALPDPIATDMAYYLFPSDD